MAVNTIDIYQSARLLMRQHGDKAGILAAMRADALLDRGDLEGVTVWKRIGSAIEELERQEPSRPAH